MKILPKLSTIVLGATLGLSSCRDASREVYKEKIIDDYEVIAAIHGRGEH